MKMNLEEAPGFTALSLLLLALLLGLQAGCSSKPTPTAAELRRLQGYWEGAGPAGKCTITIVGNSLHFYGRTDFWHKTTFTLPAGTDPKQLRATINDSAPPTNNTLGQVVVAIYKIEDGTLTLALNQGDSLLPPKTFPNDDTWPFTRYDLKKGQPQKQDTELPKSK